MQIVEERFLSVMPVTSMESLMDTAVTKNSLHCSISSGKTKRTPNILQSVSQIFEGKRNNSFHDSICKQWNDCRKLTAKQLECIIKGFTEQEKVNFWLIWFQLTNDECLKWSIPSWVENTIRKNKNGFADYMEDDAIINCLLYDRKYGKQGFHFYRDIEIDSERIHMIENGRNKSYLNENVEDEYIEVLKVVEGIQK